MKRSLWQVGLVTLTLSWVLSLALVMASPDRFIDADIEGDSFVQETTKTLALNEKLYLLEPTIRLASRLDQLDYVTSYTIERALPNKLTIRYVVETPLACSASMVYYPTSRFSRTPHHDGLCEPVIDISGVNPDVLLRALQLLDLETRNLIERIEFQAEEALVTLKTGQQAIVYPADLQGLKRLATLPLRNEVMDLRRNYA